MPFFLNYASVKFTFSKVATKINKIFTADLTVTTYRHSSIYVVNVGTQGKKRGSNNRVNQGDLVVLKGRKIKIYGISLNKVRGH